MHCTMSNILKAGCTLSLCIFLTHGLLAQEPVQKQTIEITSSFKPHLNNAVKINLHATPLTIDTSRPRMAYYIPAQNLEFAFQPVVRKPAPLTPDTTQLWGTRNYVKAGFGSMTTPYFEGAISSLNPEKGFVELYGDYISSRGKIKNQDMSEINARVSGSLFTGNNEAYGTFGFQNRENYLYGYDHNQFQYDKTDIRRSYRDMVLKAGFRNKDVNSVGINFDPHVELHAFSRESFVDESTLIATLPAEKTVGDNVKVKVEVLANVDGYKKKAANLQITNKLFQVSPSLEYNSDLFNIHAGFTPSWNNGESHVLPNIYGDVKLEENVFSIQGGWVGRYIANSFRTLSEMNPYMADPVFLNNTKETQFYGGIKASAGGHFNFTAKAAYIRYNDIPLFVNDNFDQKSFLLLNESKMNNFRIHGDLNYVDQDNFSVTAGLDLNNYSGLKDNTNAWGLYPLKLTGSLRWNAFQQLLVKADFAAFSGAKALLPNGSDKKLNGGTDLSLGAEFKINKMFSAWADFYNVFNDKYQYWNNYPVYGVQVLGGIIVRF